MLQPLNRAWRSAVSCALITVLAVVSLEPLVHTAEGHDADCQTVVVAHDAAAHRVSSGPKPETDRGDNHCVVCHLFRTSRTPAKTRTAIDALRVATIVTLHPQAVGTADGVFTLLAARAPPARA